MTIVALIPARAGSKRIPGKNTKLLAGHPLIAYTIAAAQQSGIFSDILVCTDNLNLIKSDADPFRFVWRFQVRDDQPDIVWVRDALATCLLPPDAFAILRPTSPFRTAATIRRAWREFQQGDGDSIRAVERVKQHPAKCWQQLTDGSIQPIMLGANEYREGEIVSWYSCPTQSLPTVYVQNSSLEMAWTRVISEEHSINGYPIMPFFTDPVEGFAIDWPEDWDRAEALIASGAAVLPSIEVPCQP